MQLFDTHFKCSPRHKWFANIEVNAFCLLVWVFFSFFVTWHLRMRLATVLYFVFMSLFHTILEWLLFFLLFCLSLCKLCTLHVSGESVLRSAIKRLLFNKLIFSKWITNDWYIIWWNWNKVSKQIKINETYKSWI